MQEGNLCTACAFSRLFVDQPDPFCLEFFEGLFNIVHPEGNVLDPLSLGFNVFSDWAVGGGGFEKLDFGVSHWKEGGRNLLFGNSFASEVRESENVGIELLYFFYTAYSNAYVVNFEYLHDASLDLEMASHSLTMSCIRVYGSLFLIISCSTAASSLPFCSNCSRTTRKSSP